MPGCTFSIEKTLFPVGFIGGIRIHLYPHFFFSWMDAAMRGEEGVISFFSGDSGLFLKNMYLCVSEAFYSKNVLSENKLQEKTIISCQKSISKDWESH